ncbi:MAG: hypothetical protein M3134_02730 [Actinomycetota bacterium]|nr:hypothetical protein [Actinomycetota bacterium]
MANTQLTPTFKMVLLVVVVFTSLSFVASVAISVWGPDTSRTDYILETSLSTFKLGFGALVGLLGGKRV